MMVNYKLYLVTDSTQAILRGRDLVSVVEAAIEGGVTIVQYRDKKSDTRTLIRTAKALHKVTRERGVPLLINDRVDVALAIGAEGVHIGQDDIDIDTARKVLGDNAIIGVTVSSPEEARLAAEGGADYLGIGTVFATATKEDTKSIIGARGVREILSSVALYDVRAVCIGGINASNAQQVYHLSHCHEKNLDGIAVVSAIVGAENPREAATALRALVSEPPPFARTAQPDTDLSEEVLIRDVPGIVKALGDQNPLCHNMTNLVVQNIAANVALSIGASPIMSSYGEEAADLAKLNGALVINMGTVTPEGLQNYLKALKSYNAVGGPVLFDPVGAGATGVRRAAAKTLLNAGHFDVIKGNENEIRTVAGSSVQQRGVDSGASTLSTEEKAAVVQRLAATERNVILMTGKTDIVSDGRRTYAIHNGHEFLGSTTGSGCTLGTTIASFLAVHREDKLLATISGILMFEIAAEQAARREDVRGPGSFIPAFLDELYSIRKRTAVGDNGWLGAAKVERIAM